MKLQKPDLEKDDDSIESVSQFIREGDERPTTSTKLISSTFRIPENIVNQINVESKKLGQSKTTLIKAAWLAYCKLEENERNSILLESFKI
ncbi:hypothetical protein ACUMKS_003713 [Proteus mirabilis]|uniref:hypothetical protein n=1 Tax=Proteus mirabilis TaxID=584 RepID=UPI001A2514D1|nr:hypothetical protein [Proteus mirabilis]HEM8285998.1 hypothetical protein [Providencia stuartii]EKU3804075.1 hypothetical protein [Proteus mirabilis]EKV7963313.1 hypothetical protein [Proteus mirabilis]ELB1172027.1 hypothetical protein [Proteus mirabilis]ELB2631245.1 hypothetical protein [Proteus mirabilis]